MSTSAEEKAARRAKALQRLEETKRRIAQGARSSKDISVAEVLSSGGQRPGPSALPPGSAPGQRGVQKPSLDNRSGKKTSGLLAKPYIEYDLSTMKDTKGGFIVQDQDEQEAKARATDEWLTKLQDLNPPYPFDDPRAPTCYECGIKELDFRFFYVFNKCRVCRECRNKLPEKYSLLTKTECKADYLLTEPELKDKDLLPHLERPNPYKSTYSNMMLYVRYQVEEFSFKKWGGPEGLDAEWERRVAQTKVRKQAKFEAHLREIRNKTRAQTITKTNHTPRHVHEWDEGSLGDDGTVTKRCQCGMTVNEISL